MKSNIGKLKIFIERLKKIGFETTYFANYPWIYLDTVNGNRVKEKLESDHAFTVGFYPIKKDQEFNFTDLKKIFETIREYG